MTPPPPPEYDARNPLTGIRKINQTRHSLQSSAESLASVSDVLPAYFIRQRLTKNKNLLKKLDSYEKYHQHKIDLIKTHFKLHTGYNPEEKRKVLNALLDILFENQDAADQYLSGVRAAFEIYQIEKAHET